jgi:hypothetical protein
MSHEYSSLYGLQTGPVRSAGITAVFERIIDRLVDQLSTVVTKWGGAEKVYAFNHENITIEYPDKIMRLPHIAIDLVSEGMREPGIGRNMVDGEPELVGFTKIVQFYFDIWTRASLERFLISDSIVRCMSRSWGFFRQFGIRDLKHVGTQSRNYEQERSALYQRMTDQQASRVFRMILQYEVEYDLVSEVSEEAEIIEEIIITGNVQDSITADLTETINERLGGTTELILDKQYVLTKELKGVIF